MIEKLLILFSIRLINLRDMFLTAKSLLGDGERAWPVGRVEVYQLSVFRSDVLVDPLWQSVPLSLSSRTRQ